MIKTKKWDKIFLGEIADEITERVDKPSQSGFEMFVGLEHFVSGDLKIKEWGSTKNLVSAMKKFQKGDILFARRNAYLKRASIVEFDGVCSGDAFVIREKKDRLVPGFLAFIFNSESLWHYANSYAAGTMSKRVKWRDLAKYSFKLPPLDEQKRLADLLWSVDEVEEKYLNLKNNLLKTFWAFFYKSILDYKKIKLGDVLIPKKRQSKYPHYYQKYLGLEHICSGSFIATSFGSSENAKANTFIFEKGDLLYGKLRPYLDKCIIADFNGVCSTEILVYGIKDGFLKELIFFYMHSPSFINYVSNQGYGTKMPRVSHDIISEYIISIPPIKEQKKIYEKINGIKKNFESLIINVDRCKLIQKQIINQIFGGSHDF